MRSGNGWVAALLLACATACPEARASKGRRGAARGRRGDDAGGRDDGGRTDDGADAEADADPCGPDECPNDPWTASSAVRAGRTRLARSERPAGPCPRRSSTASRTSPGRTATAPCSLGR